MHQSENLSGHFSWGALPRPHLWWHTLPKSAPLPKNIFLRYWTPCILLLEHWNLITILLDFGEPKSPKSHTPIGTLEPNYHPFETLEPKSHTPIGTLEPNSHTFFCGLWNLNPILLLEPWNLIPILFWGLWNLIPYSCWWNLERTGNNSVLHNLNVMTIANPQLTNFWICENFLAPTSDLVITLAGTSSCLSTIDSLSIVERLL